MDKLPISILQPEGPLFFGSTEPLINTYLDSSKHDMLIIDMSYVTMIDLSGVYVLEDLILNARSKKVEVFILNTNNQIKNILQRVNFIKNIGKKYFKDSKDSIISTISKKYLID